MILFTIRKSTPSTIGDTRVRTRFLFFPDYFSADGSVRWLEKVTYIDRYSTVSVPRQIGGRILTPGKRNKWVPVSYTLLGKAQPIYLKS